MTVKLVGLGAKKRSFDADEVTDIEFFVDCEPGVFDFVSSNVDLKPAGAIAQADKPRFAELVDGNDAPRRPHDHGLFFELLGAFALERVESLRHGMGALESSRVHLDPELAQIGTLRPSLLFDTFVDSHYRLSEAPSMLVHTASSTPLTKLTASRRGETLRHFERFVDDDALGSVRLHELVDRNPENVAIHRRHPIETPAIGLLRDVGVDFIDAADRAFGESASKRARLLTCAPQ